jgi:hypothetical protein
MWHGCNLVVRRKGAILCRKHEFETKQIELPLKGKK